MESSWLEREFAFRLAAMDWLTSFGADATFRYEQLAAFRFNGDRVPLTDRGRGIRKPAGMAAALSISTVFTPPNEVPPYADTEGADGMLRYKIRGGNPQQADNVALRNAMIGRLPPIWFVGVSSGVYLPRYPVHLVAEEREKNQFVVALDQVQRQLITAPDQEVSADDRRYSQAITMQRLHQPLFRARVLEAYRPEHHRRELRPRDRCPPRHPRRS